MKETFDTLLGRVTLYKNETYITKEFQRKKYWDLEVLLKLQSYINPFKNILEIGGHCGTSTLFYAKLLGKKNKVFVYEPQKRLFMLLLQNIKQNNLDNKVQAYNKAFFCEKGLLSMNKIDIDGGGGDVSKRYNEESHLPCNFGGVGLGSGGEKVLTTTLDKCKIKKVGFVHCDAQGAESFIFSKGKKFLKKHRPVILYENNKKYNPVLFESILKNYPDYFIDACFDVEKYCLNVLGYSQVIHNFNTGDDLLIP